MAPDRPPASSRYPCVLPEPADRRGGYPWASRRPSAACLHAGEPYEQAARRRVSEELKVKPTLRWLGRTAMGDDGVTKFVGVVVGEVATTDPQIQDHSHVERLRWAEIDTLKARAVRGR